MKTGILGGTFNPIHLAHLEIAAEVQQACQLDKVLFIPTADPPHKQIAGETSFQHRLAMIEAALHDYPYFQSCDLEIQRSGKSFSVDTLAILRQTNPQEEFYFIIGLDSYRDIASWKDFARLFSLCHLVVTTRPGVKINHHLEPLPVAMHKDFCYAKDPGTLRNKSGNLLIFLEETCMDISSTQVRERLIKGQSIRHLVPAAVADYIDEHKLYHTLTNGSH